MVQILKNSLNLDFIKKKNNILFIMFQNKLSSIFIFSKIYLYLELFY